MEINWTPPKDWIRIKTIDAHTEGEPLRILTEGLPPLLGKSILETPVSPASLAELLELEDTGVISNKIAKTVFEEMAATGAPAKAIVDQKGLVQVSDVSALEKIVDTVLDNNPKEVAAYKNGKTKLMGFFVGQVMRATKGKADPQIVNQL